MEILKELVAILSTNKLDQIELPGTKSASLTNKLFEAIRASEVSNDEEAAQLLYNESENSFKYKKLKNRFRTKLLSSLFFIDVSKAYSLEIERAYHQCSKIYAATSILLTRGARKTAIDLVEKYLPISNRFEFTYITVGFCRNLCSHYGTIEKNDKKYFKYKALLTKLLDTLDAEIEAESIYRSITHSLLATKKIKDNLSHNEWKKYYTRIKSMLYDFSTHTFLRNSYNVIFYYHLSNKEYDQLIKTSEEAVSRLKLKNFETRNIRFLFHLNAVIGYLQTHRYEEAINILSDYSSEFTISQYNWYVANYYLLISYTHYEKYNQAYELIKNIIIQTKFKSLPNGVQQNFFVHEAYLEFLNEANIINNNKNISNSKFRIYKFLNEIPIYSKDKSGLNISILIVHILFLLLQKKYSDIIDRVDALNQYCYRYLRNDETFRSNCFIKMLIQMSRADFNKIRTERYSEKYYNKLTSKPLNIAEHGIEIEIIPYERLWKIILSQLK